MEQTSPSRRAALTQTIAIAAAGVTAATSASAAAAAPAAAVPGAATYRVVFQVSDADPAKWNLTLNNIRNAQVELGSDRVEVELVAFGPGIGMLTAASSAAGRIAEAVEAGVRAYACENSMRGQKLTPGQMHPRASFAASGVAHLIRRQAEGYAYLRS